MGTVCGGRARHEHVGSRWLRRRPTTTSPSAVTPMLSSALTPSMLVAAGSRPHVSACWLLRRTQYTTCRTFERATIKHTTYKQSRH